MNETMKSLLNRRSIRAYEAKQVPDEILQQIVEAGRYAATGMGAQPWHFTVVQSPEVLTWIVKKNADAMAASDNPKVAARGKDPGFHTFFHAPTVIFVSGREGPLTNADCANATQNMAVAAESLGIGSCYIVGFLRGFADHMIELAARLQTPEGFRPLFSLALGYASGPAPAPAPRKDNVTYIR
jgi:nitroreductase